MLKSFSPLPYITEQLELSEGAIFEPNKLCITCVRRECAKQGFEEKAIGTVRTCFKGLHFCYLEDGVGDALVWCGFLLKGIKYTGDYRELTQYGFEIDRSLFDRLMKSFGANGIGIAKLMNVRRQGEGDALHDLKRLLAALSRVVEKAEVRTAQEANLATPLQVRVLQDTVFQGYQILGAIKAQVELVDYIAAPHMLEKVEQRDIDIYGLFYKYVMIFKVLAAGQDKMIEIESDEKNIDYHRNLMETFALLPPILLDNAIKYSVSNNTIRVRLGRTQGQIRISISSFGALIPDQDTNRIWTMGGRAEYQFITKPPGSGYGLYLAKRISESCGFSISYRGVQQIVSRDTPFGDNIFTIEELAR